MTYLKTISGFQKKTMPAGMKSPAQFVLDHGKPFKITEKTYEGKRGALKQCFKNAAQDAMQNSDRTYVEGYITVHGVPIEHAWTVDKDGNIHDSTITPDESISGYFGVPFSKSYLFKALNANKVYGLLGFESRKTLEPLLKGEEKDFIAKDFKK